MKCAPDTRNPSWHSFLAAMLAATLVFLGPAASAARAEAVTTEAILGQALSERSEADRARQRLYQVVDRPEVARELAELGVAPWEVHRRIETLSDAEVAALSGRLDEIPAGGFVGAVVGAILIVFLVLLFTDLIGATDVFPWVNKR